MTTGKSARFRVGVSRPPSRPYLTHYKPAFASCPIRYPMGSSALLTLGLLPDWLTDPTGLSLFRREPICEVFRFPESRGSLRNCESANPEYRFRLRAILAQACQSVTLVANNAVYMGFTGVDHAPLNLAPARVTLPGSATLFRELSHGGVATAPRPGRFASAVLDGRVRTA